MNFRSPPLTTILLTLSLSLSNNPTTQPNLLRDPNLSQVLEQMMQMNFMFKMLTRDQMRRLSDVMVEMPVSAGDSIIREGDAGEDMYMIDGGEFAVTKRDDADGTPGAEKEVFRYTQRGTAFGEQSLMYGKPRGATITAATSGSLWRIGRKAYRAVMAQKKEQGHELLPFLTAIPCLNRQNMTRLQRLADSSMVERFTVGAAVAHKSDWLIYVIEQGSVSCGGATRTVGHYVCASEAAACTLEPVSGAFITLGDFQRSVPTITPEVLLVNATKSKVCTYIYARVSCTRLAHLHLTLPPLSTIPLYARVAPRKEGVTRCPSARTTLWPASGRCATRAWLTPAWSRPSRIPHWCMGRSGTRTQASSRASQCRSR